MIGSNNPNSFRQLQLFDSAEEHYERILTPLLKRPWSSLDSSFIICFYKLFYLFTGPKTYENFAADLIILVDTSSGVDRKLFDRQKAFVKSLVKSLDFSLEKSRVAVISYGSTTSIGRFSSSQNKDEIASDVDNLQYKSGGRNITKALEEASSLFNTARESVSKVLVLLTTGSEPSLAAPSQTLRNRGTNVFVIAVGDAVDIEELTPVVDEPRDIFSLAVPQELTWRSDYMIDEIIKRASKCVQFRSFHRISTVVDKMPFSVFFSSFY